MATRPIVPSDAGFARFSLMLIVGGIAVAVVLTSALPLPQSLPVRVAAVVGIVVAIGAAVVVVWTRRYSAAAAVVAERLEQTEREALDAERLASVGRVAAGIAHEIGNPLTGIANYAHVLRSRLDGSREVAAAISGIEHEVDRIDRIVGNLLDYARPRSGPPTRFDAASTLRQAVDLLASQGVFRRVEVQASIAEAPLAVVGNPQEFEQAFVNVLLNAIDAMDSHGTLAVYAGTTTAESIVRPPRRRSSDAGNADEVPRAVDPRIAEWRAQHENDAVCAKFVFADSGPGVGEGDEDRIFDPFFTTKERNEGSGLGLAIVQRVMDAHGGLVWVQRAREGGAAFHMVLPLGSLPTTPDLVS